MNEIVTVRVTRIEDGQLLRLFPMDAKNVQSFLKTVEDNELITVVIEYNKAV
jgi:hypothetical protein